MNSFVCKSIDDTINLGRELAVKLKPGSVIALHGPLGAGKTALTKGIAEGLGIQDIVNSPTFTLISEYEGRSIKLFHMDLYRIDSYDDFIMIGGDELIYGENISVIEWAEKISEDLPDDTIHIKIRIEKDLSRRIDIL